MYTSDIRQKAVHVSLYHVLHPISTFSFLFIKSSFWTCHECQYIYLNKMNKENIQVLENRTKLLHDDIFIFKVRKSGTCAKELVRKSIRKVKCVCISL